MVYLNESEETLVSVNGKILPTVWIKLINWKIENWVNRLRFSQEKAANLTIQAQTFTFDFSVFTYFTLLTMHFWFRNV